MEHNPQPKGKRISVHKVPITQWDSDGNLTLKLKVTKPRLSTSKKCYLLSFLHGETDITVNIGGVDRKVRLTAMLYCKIPAPERYKTLEAEAKLAEERGDPKLY